MKYRIAVCLLFFSTLSFLSFGQQAERHLTALQTMDIQRGEAEFFKTLVYRFEIAWEESDLQSMIDLKLGLAKLMEQKNSQESSITLTTSGAAKRQIAKQKYLEMVQAISLDSKDNAFGKKAEQVKKQFNEYILLVEADLAEQAESLRK